MSKLKPGWRRVKFGEVVRLVSDRCDPINSGIKRFVGLEHIEPGDLRVRSWGDVADGTTFTNRFRPGQVLFGKRRAYQRKVAVADFDGVCSGDIYVMESAEPGRLLPELLPFICQTDTFFEHAVGTSAGSLSPRTNWTSLAGYELLLPPLEEQRQILGEMIAAAAAETSLMALDEAIEAAQASLSELYATALDTPVGPDGTPSRDALPAGWTLRSVDWLASGADGLGVAIGPFGSALLISDYNSLTAGTPVLFVGDVRRNEFRYESHRFVSAEKHRELSSHEARGGDVICNKTGWPPGVTARLPPDWPTSIITSHLVRIRLNEARVNSDYFTSVMNSHWGQVQCVRLAPGTTRPQMTLTGFRALNLAIPPLTEQAAFVERFSALNDQRQTVRGRIIDTRALVRALSSARLGGGS